MAVPPRILIVMPDQWPRALLRAALREVGYDALGTRTTTSALRIRAVEPHRGPVRLIIVDQSVLGRAGRDDFERLLGLHNTPATILLAHMTIAAPNAPWQRVLRRPFAIADVVSAAQALIPLPPESRRPLD